MSIPGEKTFYVFTAEVENVDEEKLKIAGDSFDVKTLVANKGDKVTVKFYNVDEVQTERHSFTIGDPYKVNIDVGFGGNGNATFTADQDRCIHLLLQISPARHDRTISGTTIDI